MSSVLSDLFIMGNPSNPMKAARKQANPRICNEGAALSGNNSVVGKGKKIKLKLRKRLKGLELLGFSRTEVTVIDMSMSPDWKWARVLYRKGLVWKVWERKLVWLERKKRKLLKAKARNEWGAGGTGRREQLHLLEKVLTAVGNFCISSIAVGMLIEIVVMYPTAGTGRTSTTWSPSSAASPLRCPWCYQSQWLSGSSPTDSQSRGHHKEDLSFKRSLAWMCRGASRPGHCKLNKLTVDGSLIEVCVKGVDGGGSACG